MFGNANSSMKPSGGARGATHRLPYSTAFKYRSCRPNYVEHIKATGLPFPKEPVRFLKASSSICGPNDHILLPPASERTDWETELAVITGKKASYIREPDVMDHIAGYALMNDFSERSYQMARNGTVDKAKGCNTFCPLGPHLVTKDELKPLLEQGTGNPPSLFEKRRYSGIWDCRLGNCKTDLRRNIFQPLDCEGNLF